MRAAKPAASREKMPAMQRRVRSPSGVYFEEFFSNLGRKFRLSSSRELILRLDWVHGLKRGDRLTATRERSNLHFKHKTDFQLRIFSQSGYGTVAAPFLGQTQRSKRLASGPMTK